MLEKIQHLFFYRNDVFITDISCCVIPFFLPCILKDGQQSVPQPEVFVLFWGMLSGRAHGFTKTALRCKNY